MIELRLNTKTNITSWGFSDGKSFYPFGNTDLAKAMATLLLMKYKTTGQLEEGMNGEPDGDWRAV